MRKETNRFVAPLRQGREEEKDMSGRKSQHQNQRERKKEEKRKKKKKKKGTEEVK
jgi:hypothetical protein